MKYVDENSSHELYSFYKEFIIAKASPEEAMEYLNEGYCLMNKQIEEYYFNSVGLTKERIHSEFYLFEINTKFDHEKYVFEKGFLPQIVRKKMSKLALLLNGVRE